MFPSGSRRLSEFSRPAGAQLCVSVSAPYLPPARKAAFGFLATMSVASRVTPSTDSTPNPLGCTCCMACFMYNQTPINNSHVKNKKGTAEVVVTMLAATENVPYDES